MLTTVSVRPKTSLTDRKCESSDQDYVRGIPMAINQDIKALIPTEKFCSTYLLHALIGNGDQILARCLKAGTTVESIEFLSRKLATN